MKLASDEYIITAYAESAVGPGWSNSPMWVIIGRKGHPEEIRKDCLQPDEQTPEIKLFYNTAEGLNRVMRLLVSGAVEKLRVTQ